MRIGVETECLSRRVTGVEYSTLVLIEAIKQQRHQAVCFHPEAEMDQHPSGVEHYFFRKPLRIPFSQSVAALFRRHCFDGVDIMHFTSPKILYSVKPKVPFVLTIHDLIPLRFPKFFSKKAFFLFKWILPKYIREAKAIMAASHHTKQEILRLFSVPEEKIHVVYGALLPKKREVSSEKQNYLLYIGSFEPRKNLKGIVEALFLLKSWGYEYKLILAGREGKKHAPPWELVRRYGLENDVIYKGYVSEEEKDALFRHAAVLVWPSFYEGFGFPLLEAMHYGTPIVTSKGSSTEEVVGDAGICVDPSSCLEIAHAIVQIISSKEVSQDLMHKGLRRSQDFSLNAMAENLQNLYKTCQKELNVLSQ